MRKIAQGFLILDGVILLVYAAAFLVSPDLLGRLVGFTPHSPNAQVEVMAFYGGLELGLAGFFIWSGLRPERVRPALIAFTFIFLTAGICRALGILRFGFADPSQPVAAAVEMGFSLFSIWLIRSLRDGHE